MQSAEARESIFNFMIFSIQSISPRVTTMHPPALYVLSAPLLRSPSADRPWARRLSDSGTPLYHPIEQATVGITTRWPLSMAQHLYPWRQRRRSTRVPERVECGLDGDR